MRKYLIQTNNLDRLIQIIDQLRQIHHSPGVLETGQDISQEKVIFITKAEISDLSLNQLIYLQKIDSCLIISITDQSKSSNYIAESLLGFKSFQCLSNSARPLLPLYVFSFFPKIAPGITELKSLDDLLSISPDPQEVFSRLALTGERILVYGVSLGSILPLFSICSIKKIMQYFAYRFIRDIPND